MFEVINSQGGLGLGLGTGLGLGGGVGLRWRPLLAEVAGRALKNNSQSPAVQHCFLAFSSFLSTSTEVAVAVVIQPPLAPVLNVPAPSV